jgi:hypothetical protein
MITTPLPAAVSVSARARPSWGVRVAVLALVLGSAAARLPRLAGPPLGPHDFRQTQTAITVQSWLDRGFDALHYETPVFGPPWQAPFEFPTYQASAYVLARSGLPLDAALRVASLLWFYASALLLFHLARGFTGDAAALFALAVFVLSPFSFLWGRACLIDYASVALALGWLAATAEWAERRRLPAAAAAAALGALAAATKITTVPVVVPALAWIGLDLLGRARREGTGVVRPALVLVALAAVPFAAGILWTRWADAIKAAAPATAWLTSSALSGWNFGTLAQRLDPACWREILGRMRAVLPGPFSWLVAIAGIAALRRRGQFGAATAAALLGVLLPIVTFFNLYWIHDYYLIAATPGLALLAGVGAAELLAIPLPGRGLVAVAAAAALFAERDAYRSAYRYADPAFADLRKEPVVAVAAAVTRVTPPDRWIVVEGDDWSSRIPYLSHRRAFMIRPPAAPVDLVAGRPEVATLVCAAECADELLARWPVRDLVTRVGGFSIYRLGTAARQGAARLDSGQPIP